jgi:hypothetical protein
VAASPPRTNTAALRKCITPVVAHASTVRLDPSRDKTHPRHRKHSPGDVADLVAVGVQGSCYYSFISGNTNPTHRNFVPATHHKISPRLSTVYLKITPSGVHCDGLRTKGRHRVRCSLPTSRSAKKIWTWKY